jgi:hypothetical protein
VVSERLGRGLVQVEVDPMASQSVLFDREPTMSWGEYMAAEGRDTWREDAA